MGVDAKNLPIEKYVSGSHWGQLQQDFSRLTGFDVIIFNTQGQELTISSYGRVVSSSGDEASSHVCCPAHRQSLLSAVLRQREPRSEACGHSRLYAAVPMLCDAVLFGAILAVEGRAIEGEAPARSGVSSGNSGHRTDDEQLTLFLAVLAKWLTADLRNRIDIQFLSTELGDRYEELDLLYEVGAELNASAPIESTLDYFVGKINDLLNPSYLGLTHPSEGHFKLYDPETGLTDFDSQLQAKLAKLCDQVAACAEPEHRPIVMNHLRDHYPEEVGAFDLHSLLSVPVIVEGKQLFALNLFSNDDKRTFMSGDVKVMESIANAAGIAIKNNLLYQQLRELFLNVIRSLAHTVEAKNPYTSHHSERVASYVMKIGKSLGLSTDMQEYLKWAALLHDIGKICTPDSILLNPGRLSDEEFAVIKLHPSTGAKILSPINEFQPVIPGVLHHHERYDGRGYPDGLARTDIPLLARIIAIGDTYDAMTSSRPYRNKLDHEITVEEIVSVAGAQLDPDLVESFDFLQRMNRWRLDTAISAEEMCYTGMAEGNGQIRTKAAERFPEA